MMMASRTSLSSRDRGNATPQLPNLRGPQCMLAMDLAERAAELLIDRKDTMVTRIALSKLPLFLSPMSPSGQTEKNSA